MKSICKFDDSKLELVMIGYPYCPFSKKAQSLILNHEKYKNHYKFILIDSNQEKPFCDSATFRQEFKYDGTFPIIFIKEKDGFFMIGEKDGKTGASGLEIFLENKNSKKKI